MVYVHLANGFEEIEALSCIDLMRRVGIEVKTVSITNQINVKSVRNVVVEADLLFEQADYSACEMIVLPGGMPGAKNLGEHNALVNHIVEFSKEKKWIAAICASPMILGTNGLLQGIKATIYPEMEKYLLGAEISTKRVVVDKNFITSKGPGTAMEFAIAIIEVLKGKDTAENLKKELVMFDGQ